MVVKAPRSARGHDGHMASIERARDRGIRQATDLRVVVGKELLDARRSSGLSQRHVARTARLSQSRVSRTERLEDPAPRIDELATHCAALGLRLVIKVYPEGSPVRDAGHLRLLQALRAAIHGSYRWQSEVPVAGPGDLRAWDAVLDGPARIGVDAETRLHDVQQVQRRTELKRRDSGVPYVLLLVSSSHHNRRVLREHRAALASTFPYDTGQILRALRAGAAPPGNGIVVL